MHGRYREVQIALHLGENAIGMTFRVYYFFLFEPILTEVFGIAQGEFQELFFLTCFRDSSLQSVGKGYIKRYDNFLRYREEAFANINNSIF